VNFLVIVVLLVAVMWFVFVRPQRRRQAALENLYSSLRIGDEIVTAGGLYGTIQSLGDEDLEVEIADGVVVRVARRAVAGRVEPEDEDEAEEEPEEEPEDEAEEEPSAAPIRKNES
jgi:preprotein translocase subunit YajC